MRGGKCRTRTVVSIGPVVPDPLPSLVRYVCGQLFSKNAIDIEGSKLLRPVNPIFMRLCDIFWSWTYFLRRTGAFLDRLIRVPKWYRIPIRRGLVDVVCLRLRVRQVFDVSFLAVVLVEENSCDDVLAHLRIFYVSILTVACSRHCTKLGNGSDTSVQYVFFARENFTTADYLSAVWLWPAHPGYFQIKISIIIDKCVLGLELMVIRCPVIRIFDQVLSYLQPIRHTVIKGELFLVFEVPCLGYIVLTAIVRDFAGGRRRAMV